MKHETYLKIKTITGFNGHCVFIFVFVALIAERVVI